MRNLSNITNQSKNKTQNGISVMYHDSLILKGNHVSNHSGGIGCANCTNSIISKNVVTNLSKTDVFSGIGGSIYMNNQSSTNYFINNLVYGIGPSSGMGGQSSYYNNTIFLFDSSRTVNDPIVGIVASPLGKYFNNIVSISGNSANTMVGFYLNERTMFPTSDYNNIFISNRGTGPIFYGGYYIHPPGIITGYSTFPLWRSNSGQDMNSLTVDPQFINPSTGDFTPQNLALNNSGLSLPQVTEDFYGNPRGSSPDIGAIEFGTPVGIVEEDFATMMLFPNPSQGKFTLVVTPNKKETFTLSLLDISGKELFKKELTISNARMESFDFSTLPKGIYLLKIQTENQMKTKKMIIQ